MSEEKKLNIPWFKRGDVDAVIGVFFDGFSKIIVGIGVLTGVMGMSQDIVFGKIVSAIGLSAFLLLAFNTFYARHLGKKLNRDDLTAFCRLELQQDHSLHGYMQYLCQCSLKRMMRYLPGRLPCMRIYYME